MANLPKLTLTYNENKQNWSLVNDNTNKVLKVFKDKETATRGGVLEKTLGENGGSVKIQKMNGKIQEERTYPGKKDPSESKG